MIVVEDLSQLLFGEVSRNAGDVDFCQHDGLLSGRARRTPGQQLAARSTSGDML
jgi:hypothetical protein